MGLGKEKDDITLAYFNKIKDIPILSYDEEIELSKLIKKDDNDARRRLIEANLRLVAKIARSFCTGDISMMDLIQEGNMGLLQAVDKFDHNKNVRFSTYAVWWIRQAIMRFLTNKRRTIRLPHRKEEILRRAQRAYHTLSQRNMRQPQNSEIADEIGVPLNEVEYVINMTNKHVPFEAESSGEDASTVENTHEDYTYSPERALMNQSLRDAANRVLKRLKDRERQILVYHYQLNGEGRHTLKNIGDKMGISTETVRQIEIKALKKIRNDSEDLHVYYERH